jgi:transcriptional regulator with GAF, ATPase, and Fis domain
MLKGSKLSILLAAMLRGPVIRSEMSFENIIGNSPALKHVLQLVETVAASDSTVLLLGRPEPERS